LLDRNLQVTSVLGTTNSTAQTITSPSSPLYFPGQQARKANREQKKGSLLSDTILNQFKPIYILRAILILLSIS
jgi:hypothetical protein